MSVEQKALFEDNVEQDLAAIDAELDPTPVAEEAHRWSSSIIKPAAAASIQRVIYVTGTVR